MGGRNGRQRGEAWKDGESGGRGDRVVPVIDSLLSVVGSGFKRSSSSSRVFESMRSWEERGEGEGRGRRAKQRGGIERGTGRVNKERQGR